MVATFATYTVIMNESLTRECLRLYIFRTRPFNAVHRSVEAILQHNCLFYFA